jgi:probable F420-dependent oxidoreductase
LLIPFIFSLFSRKKDMQIGVVFPQTEFGSDPAALRDFTQAVEGMGYTHILAYDHVLGANPDRPGGWDGPYTFRDPFHEVFVLFSFMAAITTRLGFITGILILPQRETALVAKQAATLDVLSGGRFRLGIGVGWNPVEYTAMGQDFHRRGKRVEEQIEVLRRLWAEPLITYKGECHEIIDAGLKPLPLRRDIPIWFGGHADVVLRRAARLGDGWLPGYRTAQEAAPALEKLARFREEAGRPPEGLGLEPRVHWRYGGIDLLLERSEGWRQAGATHLAVNTMGCGFSTPDEHLAVLQEFAREAGLR